MQSVSRQSIADFDEVKTLKQVDKITNDAIEKEENEETCTNCTNREGLADTKASVKTQQKTQVHIKDGDANIPKLFH